MTISSQDRKAGPYSGNGVTVTFPFSFKVFSASDVYVVRANSLGAETVLVLNSDYTVSLNSNQNSNPGGSVTLSAALATGYTMVITSSIGYLQPVDLTNNGGFYPNVINTALDRLTILTQQLKEDVDRSAKLPITNASDADALVADIVLLAGHQTEIDTVAGSITNVNAVAGNSTNVNTVATNITSVNTAATNIAVIQAAPTAATNAAASASAAATSASNASSSASAAATSATNASNSASAAATSASSASTSATNAATSASTAVRYIGPAAANPTTRVGGGALQAGDLYFNTVALTMRVYNGSTWQDEAASPDTLSERSFLATAGQTSYTFTGGYRVGYTYVWVNGSMLYSSDYTATDGTTITFASALTLNDEVRILSIKAVGSISIADLAGGSYGTTGQVLTSQGTGVPPTWGSVAGVPDFVLMSQGVV